MAWPFQFQQRLEQWRGVLLRMDTHLHIHQDFESDLTKIRGTMISR